MIGLTHKSWRCKLRESTSGNKTEVVWSTRYVVDRAHVCRVRVGGWENFEPFLLPKMLLIWCVHSACDPIFGQRPTINSLYVQLWLRTYMCYTTKSQLHLTWLEVWWSLGSYPSMFHHAMRGDTLSHSIETIYDLWWSFGLTHPCSTTLWAPDHSTSIIMRQCKDKGHISHPQEKPQSTSTGGMGGRGSRWVHYIGGGWGGACQTWIIYRSWSHDLLLRTDVSWDDATCETCVETEILGAPKILGWLW